MWKASTDLTADNEIPREALKALPSSKRPMFMDPCSNKVRLWKESWHVSKMLCFAARNMSCDSCSSDLAPNSLMSRGKRYIASEQAALPVSGIDVACLECVYDEYYDRPEYSKPPANDDENRIYKGKPLGEILKNVQVQSLSGFDVLTKEDRKKYVEASLGRPVASDEEAEMLQPKNQNVCDGWICVMTGAFDGNVSNLLLENGGQVKPAVTSKTTHCIVGKPAEGAFGGKSGPGSKKAKEAKKKKAFILSEEEFMAIAVHKTKTMTDLATEREEETRKKREEAKERAEQRKREASQVSIPIDDGPRRTRSRR